MADEVNSDVRVRAGGGREEVSKGGLGRGFILSFRNINFVTVFQFKNTLHFFFHSLDARSTDNPSIKLHLVQGSGGAGGAVLRRCVVVNFVRAVFALVQGEW